MVLHPVGAVRRSEGKSQGNRRPYQWRLASLGLISAIGWSRWEGIAGIGRIWGDQSLLEEWCHKRKLDRMGGGGDMEDVINLV